MLKSDMAGNTPTCVGKTAAFACAAVWAEKHPHVRGEDMSEIDEMVCVLETPPRAWGRRRSNDAAERCQGNTPTCVGKTRDGFCA